MTNSDDAGESAFERLHPAVQYHVVNSLGWPELRPLQARSIGPILDDQHSLLIAPTAGGKTEAALLPLLSRMASEEWHGLSVLYICPIKALLNNLEARLSHLANLLGRTVQLWHGDIGQGEKNRIQRELPDILLTTPESLEGILLGKRRDHVHLLGRVRCVVVDELHAFAGDDRGWHLLTLLERIRSLGQSEPQRIGLSATVGEPKVLLDWLAGHCEGQRTLVQIKAPPEKVDLHVDYAGSLDNAAILISQLHQGEKRLVFCDSRSRVESLSLALRGLGVTVFVSHAALSADTRRQAEQAFAENQNCVIIATSTLELGLDVGDLDRVIQIDAPTSVASFLQRMGRTGRRAGSWRNMLFIATRDDALLESLAIVQLFESGYVEPVTAPPMPIHVLVQQLFATLFQHEGELEEHRFLGTLRRIPGFAEIIDMHWETLSEHLIATGYLHRNGMLLTAGLRADQAFQGRGLADLCVAFDSPRALVVLQGNKLLGYVDPVSLAARQNGQVILALGGRSWQVASIDWARDRVYVESAAEKGVSRWLSSSRGVSRPIASEVRHIVETSPSLAGATLTRRARQHLEGLREAQKDTLTYTPIRLPNGDFEWWTYAGLAHNTLLAARIKTAGGMYSTIGGYSFRFQLPDAAIQGGGGWKDVRDLEPSLEPSEQHQVKFAEMLPAKLLTEMYIQRISSAA